MSRSSQEGKRGVVVVEGDLGNHRIARLDKEEYRMTLGVLYFILYSRLNENSIPIWFIDINLH